MTITYPNMADLVPAAQVGGATVEHFEISERDASFANLRQAINPHRYDPYDRLLPGRYAKLTVDGTLMMTDTPMERVTNNDFVRHAHGRVLIAGLGLGMILHPVLEKPNVEHVAVLEVSADVIALVAPTLSDDRLTLINANVFDWKPAKGHRFDTIYFDIWPDLSAENLAQMQQLHARYRRYLDRGVLGYWMGSWRRNTVQRLARGWR